MFWITASLLHLLSLRFSMEVRRKPKLFLHYLRLHFGVAVDVILISYGLYLLAGLIHCLPHSLPSLSSPQTVVYITIVTSLWNLTSLAAVAAFIGTVVFLPPTQRNRRRTQNWLILALCCQAILALVPNRQDAAILANTLTPVWIGIAVLILLLHLDSRLSKSDRLIIANSLQKGSLKDQLKKGFTKLGAVVFVVFAATLFVSHMIFLTRLCGDQLASRSWPVAKAKLIRCETLENKKAVWNSDFHLEYEFEAKGVRCTGNDYDLIMNNPTAFQFNAAKETVEQL